MKLQRQSVGKYKRKDGTVKAYQKFVILVPNSLVESLGWEPGLELDLQRAGEVIVVYRASAGKDRAVPDAPPAD